MKLIFAILRDMDADPVTQGLTVSGYRVTRVASTGGFLRRGTTTLLIGVGENQLESAIEIMKKKCAPSEDGETRATIFVTNVDRFEQI